MVHKQIPAEALLNLRHRLDGLPSRCQERQILIEETATLYGVSSDTLYRALRNLSRPMVITQLPQHNDRADCRTEHNCCRQKEHLPIVSLTIEQDRN